MSEQLLHDRMGAAQTPESVATAPTPNQLFDIDQSLIADLCPSVNAGSDALVALRESSNPLREDDETAAKPEPVATEANEQVACECGGDHSKDENVPLIEINRKSLRDNFNMYRRPMTNFITAGMQLIASAETPEEGIATGEKILKETGGDIFMPVWTMNIVPAAPAIREIHQASRTAKAELDTVIEAGPEARYNLLKAFAAPTKSKQELAEADASDQPDDDGKTRWQPVQVLHALTTLSGPEVPRQLTAELNTGAFDPFIAQDVLEFVDRNPDVTGELARVRQFATFMTRFVGGDQNNKAQVHARMVQTLDSWPASERQAVVEARSILSATAGVNAGQAGRWLRERGFANTNDQAATFEASADALTSEFIKRIPVGNPAVRHMIMGLRANIKGRRSKRSKKPVVATETVNAETEERREPMKLVTCNLNDHTTTEGVEGLINEYMVELGQQGNKHLRDDLDKIVAFMARTNLTANSRRGVKPIDETQVRFGKDNKLWNFLEFKPSAATDLTLKTQQGKNSRAYFIRLDGETLGLLGIKPRSKQDIFIRSVRARLKRRG